MTYFAEVMMQTLFIVIICFFQIRQLDLNQISYLVKVGNDFLTNGENNLLTYIWNVCNAIDMFRHEIQIISYHRDFTASITFFALAIYIWVMKIHIKTHELR